MRIITDEKKDRQDATREVILAKKRKFEEAIMKPAEEKTEILAIKGVMTAL